MSAVSFLQDDLINSVQLALENVALSYGEPFWGALRFAPHQLPLIFEVETHDEPFLGALRIAFCSKSYVPNKEEPL